MTTQRWNILVVLPSGAGQTVTIEAANADLALELAQAMYSGCHVGHHSDRWRAKIDVPNSKTSPHVVVINANSKLAAEDLLPIIYPGCKLHPDTSIEPLPLS